MTAEYDQIVKLIPKLTDAERGKVKLALRASGGMSGVAAASSTKNPYNTLSPELKVAFERDWLLQGIARLLVARGEITKKGVYFLTKRDSYSEYVSALPAVMEYLGEIENVLNTTTKHRTALANICARAQASMLQKRKYYSVNAMLSQISKLPEALDESFPGYYRSGLLKYVIEREASEG